MHESCIGTANAYFDGTFHMAGKVSQSLTPMQKTPEYAFERKPLQPLRIVSRYASGAFLIRLLFHLLADIDYQCHSYHRDHHQRDCHGEDHRSRIVFLLILILVHRRLQLQFGHVVKMKQQSCTMN